MFQEKLVFWLVYLCCFSYTLILKNSCSFAKAEQEQQIVDFSDPNCSPFVNLPFNGQHDKQPDVNQGNQSSDQKQQGVSGLYKNEFKFKMGNLTIPLADILNGSHGSLGIAAMKLLTSFSDSDGDNGNGNIDDEQAMNGHSNSICFVDNELGVKGLNLSMLSVHLYANSDPKCGLGINARNVTLTGRFIFNSQMLMTENSFTGYYRMQISDVYLTASSNLTKQQHENIVLIDTIQRRSSSDVSSNAGQVKQAAEKMQTLIPSLKYYNLVANNLHMNISNLGTILIEIYDTQDMSGPQTSNSYLRMLKRILQKSIKKTYYTFESDIRRTIEYEARKSIDCQLTKFSGMLETNSSYLADLARILGSEIRLANLNKVPLSNCSYQATLLGAKADIEFTNGTLQGLDNVRLPGETRIKLQDQHLLVNSSIGWYNLSASYDWTLKVSTNKEPMSRGKLAVAISELNLETLITRGLQSNAQVIVEQLIISKMDAPKLDISGLPGLNRLTRTVLNFFMRSFKQRLSSSLQPVLQKQLESSLNKLEAGKLYAM